MSKQLGFLKTLLSPAKYLSVINVINAGLGTILGIINARLLGPDAFGIIGVIAGTNTTVVNFLDIRLVDVVGKLYYRPDLPQGVEGQNYRSSVLQVYIVSAGLLGLLIMGVGYLVTVLTIHLFTESSIKIIWIAISTYVYAMNYWAGAFMYQQRFSERFYLIGTWRLVTQLLTLASFLIIVLPRPNLDGYFAGSFVSTTLNAAMIIGLSLFIWHKYEGFSFFSCGMFVALKDYWREIRMILWGNVLGYTKMLHRGSDVLLVGYFADDRITGLYKVARSLADAFYVLYDALNQVYYPRFMQLLSAKSFAEYRHTARRMITSSALLVAGVLGLEVVGLTAIVKLVLTTRFQGVEAAIIILTFPVFFVIGFYTWFWPIFVHTGSLGRFTLFNILACSVQYLVVILTFHVFGPSPALAATGYLGYYLFIVPVALILARNLKAEALPSFQNNAGRFFLGRK